MAAPQDWTDEQGVLHKYDKSQYNSQPSQSAGGKNTNENPSTPKSFRYPYNLKIDRDTDYLEIRIAEYQAPGLIERNTDTTQGFSGYGNAPTGTSSNTRAATPENFGRSLQNPKAYISLPIPQSISDTAQVTWGEDTLDPLSAFAVGFGAGLIDPNSKLDLKAQAVNILNTAKLGFDEQTKNALIGAISGKAYGALGGNVSVTSLIARASGQVFNPNLELLFQGVTLRSFPFTFDFVPRNSAEARTVKNIIRTFKQSMTAKSSSSSTPAGVFIKAPDVFQLTYKRGPNAHPFLNKFKPMALTNMQLNYTGSNTYATYADGTPVHINMSLTFTELNPIYAEDYTKEDIGVGY